MNRRRTVKTLCRTVDGRTDGRLRHGSPTYNILTIPCCMPLSRRTAAAHYQRMPPIFHRLYLRHNLTRALLPWLVICLPLPYCLCLCAAYLSSIPCCLPTRARLAGGDRKSIAHTTCAFLPYADALLVRARITRMAAWRVARWDRRLLRRQARFFAALA